MPAFALGQWRFYQSNGERRYLILNTAPDETGFFPAVWGALIGEIGGEPIEIYGVWDSSNSTITMQPVADHVVLEGPPVDPVSDPVYTGLGFQPKGFQTNGAIAIMSGQRIPSQIEVLKREAYDKAHGLGPPPPVLWVALYEDVFPGDV